MMKKVLTHLQLTTNNTLSTTKEINDEKLAACKEFLDGITQIEALYDKLCTEDYTYDIKLVDGGSVEALFLRKRGFVMPKIQICFLLIVHIRQIVLECH
jgi:hypothetical protein